ncbi:barrier-to-autointegration factor-like protein [Saccostrea cucullata]|uniref:barrier-to-autointegration factor-like protein n=1 Tax=Saccostrea cuccullata TaxID=36930 RepID=UPI002ECFE2B4
MSSTSQKHAAFIQGPLGLKPVTASPGIGPVIGQKMTEAGFGSASQVLGQYLIDPPGFKGWVQGFGANAGQQTACFNAFDAWCKNFVY